MRSSLLTICALLFVLAFALTVSAMPTELEERRPGPPGFGSPRPPPPPGFGRPGVVGGRAGGVATQEKSGALITPFGVAVGQESSTVVAGGRGGAVRPPGFF
ncbi:uncharacterized protein L969DRAFT_616843 [Mixia osmundae IAM 14324]|uniref:Uncharacterized protein n=1 Tax=Mixia osmundae (strain CBS 9802 / IAM 14324 / JCM 22182 / KY 12970) TaxID=764103 RepID=G7E617_MIXOS|nr:uncharacterized protein L969DRAFT_616843 [Mixia osmundae IAM 14324]KEI40574.1 hypothetical protein L969DRAFT_616843 [Mixia osmundae IAM 14324]GAA98277.1 hypothetical protein E5Q_04960 [Mixia osmundae IAM 14324]